MILLDDDVFYAEVKYFGNNNTISLVKGHDWAYIGKTAWKRIGERWKDETKDWFGSNYLCYLPVLKHLEIILLIILLMKNNTLQTQKI